MASTKSPAGSVRRHGRNISHPIPRRSSKGPLEELDDPLANKPVAKNTSNVRPSEEVSSTHAFEAQSTPLGSLVDDKHQAPIDLHFLLDRANYHPIPTDDIPEAFLNSPNQPFPGTPLAELLQHGHFRSAAETALDDLLQSSPEDSKRIFALLYSRLACLVLISRPDLASHEAAPLTDYLARNPPGARDVVPLIPWELRLLLVRLESLAAVGGGRRGVMAMYSLAAEVRAHAKEARGAEDESALAIWSERLHDLGLRVADTLVEMGELETATRHLDTLVDVDADDLAYRKALLRIRVGDIGGALRIVAQIQSADTKASLDIPLQFANGEFDEVVNKVHLDDDRHGIMFANNLAIALLYTGQVSRARDIFETLVKQASVSQALLFNLGTVYELCTERAMERKMQLVQSMAAKLPAPESGGWEKANFEFKL